MKFLNSIKIILVPFICCGCVANSLENTIVEETAGQSGVSLTEIQKDSDPISDQYDDYFVYNYESTFTERFTVSEDGHVVTALSGGRGFYEYSMDGSTKKMCDYKNLPDGITFMGGDFYAARTKSGNGDIVGMEIYKIDLATGSEELYAECPLHDCYTMCGNDSEIYIIGKDPEKAELNCFFTQDFATFFNNHYSVFRICGGQSEKLDVDFPTAVCADRSGGATIAACDDDGYYFIRYKNGSLTEKKYSASCQRVSALSDISDDLVICNEYAGSGESRVMLVNMNDITYAELFPNTEIYGDALITAGGYCFFEKMDAPDNNVHNIERIKLSSYYRSDKVMTLISSEWTNSENPFGCGYTIKKTAPSNEETALKIMSQDKDYDLCFLNTRDDISRRIRDKGSFYPLNDIKGVPEYLDRCFPTIKDAFTDENGNIWGLPIKASPVFIYSNAGAELSGMSLSEFVDYFDSISDEDMSKVRYSTYTYHEALLSQYIMTHDSFDTPEFRAAAEKLKNSGRLNNGHSSVTDQSGDVLINMFIQYDLPADGFKISGIPCVSESDKLIANVMFLCVNPNSDNLDDVLNYIAELAKYQSGRKDLFIFSDADAYSYPESARQVCELFGNSEVTFTCPPELYWDGFNDYLAGNITLDSFIKETDRKLKTYLNE